MNSGRDALEKDEVYHVTGTATADGSTKPVPLWKQEVIRQHVFGYVSCVCPNFFLFFRFVMRRAESVSMVPSQVASAPVITIVLDRKKGGPQNNSYHPVHLGRKSKGMSSHFDP